MKILSVCKSYHVSVRESGDGDFWAECPLCDSNHPTLLIDARDNKFQCYECKRHGSAGYFESLVRAKRNAQVRARRGL